MSDYQITIHPGESVPFMEPGIFTVVVVSEFREGRRARLTHRGGERWTVTSKIGTFSKRASDGRDFPDYAKRQYGPDLWWFNVDGDSSFASGDHWMTYYEIEWDPVVPIKVGDKVRIQGDASKVPERTVLAVAEHYAMVTGRYARPVVADLDELIRVED